MGTWNVRDLHTANGLHRLMATSDFMCNAGVAVLAVQETKLDPEAPKPSAAGLCYYGEAPMHLPGAVNRMWHGTRFLVLEEHAPNFHYLGTPAPLVDSCGAVWACW